MYDTLLFTAIGAAAAPVDLSPLTLFMKADAVVKLVMIGLLATSVWSWAIIVEKVRAVARLQRQAMSFEKAFWSGRSLEELRKGLAGRKTDPMARIFHAGVRAFDAEQATGLRSEEAGTRIVAAMRVAAGRVLEDLERRTGFLATVGSVAPFVGLFGTVWGIMNTFGRIAETGATSLIVVAPGLAEALFATALGLIAAIPATTAYNKIISDIARYGGRLDAFGEEFGAHLSRELANPRTA